MELKRNKLNLKITIKIKWTSHFESNNFLILFYFNLKLILINYSIENDIQRKNEIHEN